MAAVPAKAIRSGGGDEDIRIPTGIPGFDALVQGGIPSGAAVIVQGPAGREKDTFLFQFIVEGLRSGGCALVVLSSVSPARYQQELRDAGVDVDRALRENRLKFVDWFTYKQEPVQDVRHDGSTFKAPIDLANVGIAASRAIASMPREGELRAAVDLLSPALGIYDLREVHVLAKSTKAKLERFGFTSLFALDKELHDDHTISSIQELFDGVVDIEGTKEADRHALKIAVLSLRDTAADSKYVPLGFGADRLLRVSADSPQQLTLHRQTELIKERPNDPKLWLAAARNLKEMGLNEQAVHSVQSALDLDGRLLEAWALKAEILEALGRHVDAEEARARGTLPLAPPAKKLDHAARLLAFAEQRLRSDPHDADALFVMAASRAKEKDFAEGVAILQKLAEVDDTYPGLWILKTMLHAKLGQLEEAQEARRRRMEVELRLNSAGLEVTPSRPEPEPSQVCASCHTAVLDEEVVCPRCGATIERAQELPLPSHDPPLDASAVQPPVKGPEPKVQIPLERAPKGFTNGLGKDFARRTGMTNGLVNGTRPGGMTNGVASGLHSLRTGMTNGLTNGSGFTNGLGSSRYRREAAARRWKVYLIPVLSAALLVAPLLAPADGGRLPIAIDGDFADWGGVTLLASAPGTGVPPNVDLVRVGVGDNVAYLAFYFEVAGAALAGGGSPAVMDTFRAFLDTDRDTDTGYLVAGIGADRLVEVSGSDGRVRHAQMSEWDGARDPLDWGGWIKAAFLSAASGGPRVEAHVDWLALAPEKVPMDVAFHAMAYDGSVDMAEDLASTTAGTLRVVETTVVPETIAGTAVPLTTFALSAAVRDVAYDSLTLTLAGTAPVSAISELRLVDGLGTDLGVRVPLTQEVTFQFTPPRTLRVGETEELTLVASSASSSGDTLGALLDKGGDIGAGSAAVSVVRVPGARAVGYLGTIPTQAVVDGGFAEWMSTTADSAGEPGVPARIDLVEYSFYLNAVRASMYIRVSGQALDGAVVPALPASAPEGGVAPPADADRDRVPDAADPFPFDFNNDGVADVATRDDYDGDGIVDYPVGPDHFLNTTIPGTFPAPYTNLEVSVYIGPINRPVVLGEDVARVLIDADNDTATGFAVDAIGADYLVEIRGKHGVMTSQRLSAFDGVNPWDWTWTLLEAVLAASAFGRVELSFDVLGRNLSNASQAYFELRDWSGALDSSGQPTTRLGTRAGVRPQPLDIGGNTRYWLRNTNHGETDCTYNKNASATQGSGPAQTLSLTAGQSACWYADATTGTTIAAGNWETLLDLAPQDASNTTASTETITTGSKFSGVFPGDIQTENGLSIQYRESTDSAEASIAYRSNTGTNTVNSPKTRTWDGTTWSGATEESTAGSPIRGVRMAWNPVTFTTRIIVTQSDDGWLDAYVCTPSCTVTTDIGQVWSAAPSTAEMRFDIAYEYLSGDALLVYGVFSTNTARDIAYRTYVGGSWSAEQYLDDTGHGTDIQYSLIKLASDQANDRIGLIGGDDTNDDANAWIWDGTAWGSFTEISATAQSPNEEEIAIAWESSSGHVLAVAAEMSQLRSKEYTTSWSSAVTFSIGAISPMQRLSLNANPVSNDMVIAVATDGDDMGTAYWTGSAWANGVNHEPDPDTGGRSFDFAWEPTGSKGLLVWGDTAGQISRKTFTAPNTWSGQTDVAMGANAHPWVQVRTNPFPRAGATKILGAVMETTANDLGAIRWDGTTFTVVGASTFTADTGTASWESFELDYHATNDDQLLVQYNWTGVPASDSYTLQVKGYREDENINVQVLTAPATWNTRITISATSNTMHTYPLTSAEYNSGAPAVRFVDAGGAGGMQSDFWIDYANIISAAAEYDVDLQIWNLDTNTVAETIGSCVNLTTRGDDVQCLVPGIAAKTIASNQVVRIRIAHSSALGTVTISYDDFDATGDSRITVPIPEFGDVVLPVVAIVLMPIVWRWSHRRTSRRGRGASW